MSYVIEGILSFASEAVGSRVNLVRHTCGKFATFAANGRQVDVDMTEFLDPEIGDVGAAKLVIEKIVHPLST